MTLRQLILDRNRWKVGIGIDKLAIKKRVVDKKTAHGVVSMVRTSPKAQIRVNLKDLGDWSPIAAIPP
jgi:hypothetical protein